MMTPDEDKELLIPDVQPRENADKIRQARRDRAQTTVTLTSPVEENRKSYLSDASQSSTKAKLAPRVEAMPSMLRQQARDTYQPFPALASKQSNEDASSSSTTANSSSEQLLPPKQEERLVDEESQYVLRQEGFLWRCRQCLNAVNFNSPSFRSAFKAAFAYLLASMFTLLPPLRDYYGPTSYLCATGMTWYQPARSLGGMLHAFLVGMLGLVFATLFVIPTLALMVYLHQDHHLALIAVAITACYIAAMLLSYTRSTTSNQAFVNGSRPFC